MQVAPIHTFHNMRGEQIVKGIGDEIIDNLSKIGGAFKEKHLVSSYRSSYTHTPFDVESMKRVLLDMALKEKINILLHSYFFSASVEGNNIKSIKVINKSGIRSYTAKFFIDASGDADLISSVNNEYFRGDSSGKAMAGSLMI